MKKIDRREFLKKTGEGAAAVGAVALAASCAPKKTAENLAEKKKKKGPDVLETAGPIRETETRSPCSTTDACVTP